MVLLGGAGILGTYSLWMIVFGFWSRIIALGLAAGIVGMLPLLLVPRLAFDIPAAWVGVVAATLIKVSPVCVALVWLALSPKATHGVPRTLKELSSGGIAVIASLAFPVLALFAPVWATPIAKLWYEPGFEKAVAKALMEIPDYENACIYDDTRHMFVSSIERLDVQRMIEKAVQDKAPRPRLNGLQRDPHFRVYNGRNTYYWSFRDEQFHAFRGDRWTLAGTGKRLCEAYGNSPAKYRHAFQARHGMTVSEANFCCNSGQRS